MGVATERAEARLRLIWGSEGRMDLSSPSEEFELLARRMLGNFRAAPIAAALTVLVCTITLFIFAAVLLFFQNMEQVLAASHPDLAASIYLKEGVSPDGQEQLGRELSGLAGVTAVRFYGKDAALEELRQSFRNYEFLLDGFDRDNPLPARFEVLLADGADLEQRFARLSQKFSAHPQVDTVLYSQGVIGQLSRLLGMLRYFGVCAVAILFVCTGFIIASTIRLTILARQDELELMRLGGASAKFINSPYLFEGIVQGLVGGILAVLGLMLGYQLIVEGLASIEALKPFNLSPSFLSPLFMLLVLICGAGLGAIGSHTALRRLSCE